MESGGKISTGSHDVDKWLSGGYEKNVITMIAGPPGSGKTNFCMLAACSQAREGKKVVFVDTEGGFSIERAKQITGGWREEVLKNVLLLSPTNFAEQRESFRELLKKVVGRQVEMIVIDGMAMLYRIELSDASKNGDEEKIRRINAEVAGQMRDLSEISRKQVIPIIITNQVYGDFLKEKDARSGVERKINLVGGDLFKYWSKCIIELKNDNRKRKCVLLKHRSLPQKEFNFEIKDEGIFRRGWI